MRGRIRDIFPVLSLRWKFGRNVMIMITFMIIVFAEWKVRNTEIKNSGAYFPCSRWKCGRNVMIIIVTLIIIIFTYRENSSGIFLRP